MRLSVQKLLAVWVLTLSTAFTAFNQNDLSLSVTSSAGQVGIGDAETFTVTVSNEGATNVTGVEVTVTLPTGVSLGTPSTTAGSYAAGTWTIGSIAAGTGSVTLTLPVTLTGTGVQTLQANITAMVEVDGDSDPTDNSVLEDDYGAACMTVPFEYCAGETVDITATAAAGHNSYQWFKDNVAIPGATNQTYNITAAGNYRYETNIGATGSCAGGSCCDIMVIENALPTAGITNNDGVTELTCSQTSISLTATGGGTYLWSDAGGTTTANLSVTSPATYTVTVTSADGCTATSQVVITQDITPPTAGITNNDGTTELTCSQTSISLTATGGGTYLWSDAGGTTTAGLTVSSPATYTVTVTAANGCTATSQVVITEDVTPPTAGITNNDGTTEITCLQTSISLTATGGGTYLWSDAGGTTTAGLTVTTAGTYTVTVTAANGCTATSQVTITGSCTVDYADLPDGTAGNGPGDYNTTSANSGPSHGIITGLVLGTNVDAEGDGQPSAGADGDDTDGSDDDDGTVIGSTFDIVPGGTIRIPYTGTNSTGNNANLVAWVDWNNDGVFAVGEQVTPIVIPGTGAFSGNLVVAVPESATTATNIGVLVRLSNSTISSPDGYLSSGEVESYMLSVNCPTQICLPATSTKN